MPRISGREMMQFLQRRGFSVVRIRGSHHVMTSGSVQTSVPVHGNQSLKTGTLRKILRDVDLTPAEFEALLNP